MRESLDRLSPALVSGDLTMGCGRRDADFIAALGYASKDYPIASPLIRMYLSRDKASVHEARSRAAEMAKRAARRHGAILSFRETAEIGRAALEYSVNKVCPRCKGTKYELVPGTNRQGTKPCQACGGDGRKPVPRRHRRIIIEVIAAIERIESTLDSIVAKRV